MLATVWVDRGGFPWSPPPPPPAAPPPAAAAYLPNRPGLQPASCTAEGATQIYKTERLQFGILKRRGEGGMET